MNKNNRQCVVIVNWDGGNHLSLSNDQIEDMLRHWLAPHPKPSQEKFCKKAGYGRGIYWRVTALKLKHKSDRERVASIARERLGYDIRAATGVYEPVALGGI